MADECHRFVAARTGGRRDGGKDLCWRSFPIQQGQDALPSGFGGGTEPAEVADPLKAFGQDVLEEAAQELRGAEPQRAFGDAGEREQAARFERSRLLQSLLDCTHESKGDHSPSRRRRFLG